MYLGFTIEALRDRKATVRPTHPKLWFRTMECAWQLMRHGQHFFCQSHWHCIMRILLVDMLNNYIFELFDFPSETTFSSLQVFYYFVYVPYKIHDRLTYLTTKMIQFHIKNKFLIIVIVTIKMVMVLHWCNMIALLDGRNMIPS
jgi:hypothetical protein